MPTWVEDPPGSGLYAFVTGFSSSPGARLTQGFLDGTRLARTVIWIYRDGQPQDGFIVWQRPRRIGSRQLEIRALSLLSYLTRRTLNQTRSYTAQDQAFIARDLVNWAQAQPAGDIAIETPGSTTGVLRDRLPIAYGFERKKIGELLEQLAAVEGGFEYSIDASLVDDAPQATFRVYYPRRGRSHAQTGLLLFRSGDKSGNLLDYGLDEDASEMVTTIHAIGAGEDRDMLISTQTDTSLLDQGWPLLEDVLTDHKDVTVQSTLDSHARATVKRRARIAQGWQLRVDPDDVSVPFGAWTVGDEVRVVIEDDERFPGGPNGENGYDNVLRIVGHQVTVHDDGGPDTVMLDAEEIVDV